MSGILAFFQWAIGAGFWRFAGVVCLITAIGYAVAEVVTAFARVVAAFRRAP